MNPSFYSYHHSRRLTPEQRLRKQLIRDIYYRVPLAGDTPEQINGYYGYHLEPGAYQLLLLRVMDRDTPAPPEVMLQVEDQLCRDLGPLFKELETAILENRIVCLFNITSHRDSPATDQFKLSIGRFFAELSTSHRYGDYAYVMSEGIPAESIETLDQCFQSAVQAMEYGAIYGLNQRYDSYEQVRTLGNIMSILTTERKTQLRQLVETLNLEGLSQFISALFQDSYQQVVVCPALAYQLPHRLLELTANAAAEYYINDGSLAPLLESWHQKIDDCLDLEQLRQLTISGIQELCDQYRKQLAGGRSPAIMQAKNYINQHYREKIYLPVLAEHVQLNHQYLSVLFKKETGISISDYIAQVRMEQARFLLRNTTDSIQSIAEAVGYADPQYFSRRFHQTVGISPQTYRTKSKCFPS